MFGRFLITFLLLVFSVVCHGWVFSILWSWFVVPTFGLPALSVANAIGIRFMARTLSSLKLKDDSKKEKFSDWCLTTIMYPFVILGFGYIIHSFM